MVGKERRRNTFHPVSFYCCEEEVTEEVARLVHALDQMESSQRLGDVLQMLMVPSG